MKVLVTGAAGFLGRHVVRHFKENEWQVTAFDLDEPTGEDVDFVIGDLTDLDDVRAAVKGYTHVVHIGAIGDVYLAGENPPLAAAVNVVGTANVLRAAIENSARVIYASTWEVYGEPEREPLDETHPTNPDHPYNITKLGGEALVMAACHLEGADAVALRLGTAYGSGLRPNSVFRIFIDKARAGEPLTIQGDGSQGRQFTHAHDIARAFEIAARSDVKGQAFNIVAPDVTSIKELADSVASRFPTEVTYGEPRPGDVPPALVSAESARIHLGWEAEVSFSEGLEDLIESVIEEN